MKQRQFFLLDVFAVHIDDLINVYCKYIDVHL